MAVKYSVIIPCYNEEAVIAETHKRLTAVMEKMDGEYELIYVNDGSKDRTPELLRDLAERDRHVRAVLLAKNAGHQLAVTAGLDYAHGEAVVIIDADLQDPPEVIPLMAEKWKAGAQVVSGHRKARKGETAFKKWTASVYYKLLNAMTGGMIPRDTGDFRLVDRKAVDAVRAMREHDRFLRGMFAYVGFRQDEVFYDRDKRFAGETHYPLKKMLRLAQDGIFSFSFKPLEFIALFGMLLMGISGVLFLVLLISLLCGNAGGNGWLCLLMLFLAGSVELSLGIIGDYIGRIYNETRNRPLYIVADVVEGDSDEQ